jgi:hypothetical protein
MRWRLHLSVALVVVVVVAAVAAAWAVSRLRPGRSGLRPGPPGAVAASRAGWPAARSR